MMAPREEEQLTQTDEPLTGSEPELPVPDPLDADTTDTADAILDAFNREFRTLVLAETEGGGGGGGGRTEQAVGDDTGLSKVDEEALGGKGKRVEGSGYTDCEEAGRGTDEHGVPPEVVGVDDKRKLEYSDVGATEEAIRDGLDTALCSEEGKDKVSDGEDGAIAPLEIQQNDALEVPHSGEKKQQEEKEFVMGMDEMVHDVRQVECGEARKDEEEGDKNNGNTTGERYEMEDERNRYMEEAHKEAEAVTEKERDAKSEQRVEVQEPPNNKEGTAEERNEIQYCSFPQRPNAPDCAYYVKTGKCAYGLNCKFNHPPKGAQNENMFFQVKNAVDSAELNFLGLPLRPGERECPFYMRNGLCKFSTNCKFHHPDPTTVSGNSSPSAYNGGYRLPNPGGFQLPVRPRPTTVTYHKPSSWPNMLWMCQPPQVVDYSHAQNGSQQLSPSFASPRQPPPVSDSNHRPNSYNYQQPNPMPEFPQRYGQPDCPYYMKTGDCKYRHACKFNHPKKRFEDPPRGPTLYHPKGRSQDLAASRPLLNPLGLPLRPGQDVCIHYKHQGICKYGPSCKYDHPMDMPPAQQRIKPRWMI